MQMPNEDVRRCSRGRATNRPKQLSNGEETEYYTHLLCHILFKLFFFPFSNYERLIYLLDKGLPVDDFGHAIIDYKQKISVKKGLFFATLTFLPLNSFFSTLKNILKIEYPFEKNEALDPTCWIQ